MNLTVQKNNNLMKRKLQDYIFIIFKGMGMGAADVVPGVSGGTIAFITGIYEELIASIKSFNPALLKTLFKEGIVSTWKKVNGAFLLSVLFGIFLSVISLAKVFKELLEIAPIMLWAFFFGLIIGSAVIVGKQITKWDIINILSLLAGIAAAFTITSLTPAQTPEEYWFIFLAGAVAICAMILPGISGAFILLIMGKYHFILDAISKMKLDVIFIFGIGAVLGIVSFSNVISWLFKKFKNATTAILTGFMIGSLNKVWPWKETLSWTEDSHGILQPLYQRNILPSTYTELYGESNQLIFAGILIAAGFLIVILFDKVTAEE